MFSKISRKEAMTMLRDASGNTLEAQSNKCALCDNIKKVSRIKRAIKSLLMERAKDTERDSLLDNVPNVVMIFFVDAIRDRDFETMKRLLPHLFQMKDKLYDAYRQVLSMDSIFNNNYPQNISVCLDSCQKDLINLSGYTDEDTWLLVMFALLKPLADILPMCNSWAFGPLTFDYNSSKNKNEFNKCQQEMKFASQHVTLLSECYNKKDNTIQKAIGSSEQKFMEMKRNMVFQNTLFNIINVFAWLPLLLTNVKRMCYGQPLRLFHYVGSDYHKKVVWNMLDVIAQQNNDIVSQNNFASEHANLTAAGKCCLATAGNIVKALISKDERGMTWPGIELFNFIEEHTNKLNGIFDVSQDIPDEDTKKYIVDVYRLYRAQLLIKAKANFNATNRWLLAPFSDPTLIEISKRLKEETSELIRSSMRNAKNGVQQVMDVFCCNAEFKDIAANIKQATKNNEHAVAIITMCAHSTIPIYATDFDTLPKATFGLEHLVDIMRLKGWLKRRTANLVFASYFDWDEALRSRLDGASNTGDLIGEDNLQSDSTLVHDIEEKLRVICAEKKVNFPESTIVEVPATSSSMRIK